MFSRSNLGDFYLRFIDDIILVWNGTKTEFDNFLEKINECHHNIRSEYEMSETEINFFNTTVFKVDKKLRTKVYAKPTKVDKYRQSHLQSKSEQFH